MKKTLVTIMLLLTVVACKKSNQQSPSGISPAGAPSAQAAHSVTLTWTQGTCTSCTITGNNVYKASASGGPWTAVNSSSTPITTWIDNNVVASTTYYYTVTSVCSACTMPESNKSGVVSATIPPDSTQPQPPGIPTVVVQ